MARLKLTEAEHSCVVAAAEAVRARTSARFETLIVPVSDRYALYPVAFGAFAALAAGGIAVLALPALSARDLFAGEAILFAAVSVLLEWLPLKLLLVPKRHKHERALQFAHRAFAARILAAHERRPGMVLFLGLGERAIELVTDDELDRRVGQARWNAIVRDFTLAAKDGRVADGLVAAIEACGEELAEQFPK